MEVQVTNEELDLKIAAIKEDAEVILTEIRGLVIADQSTVEAASGMLSTIKSRMKRITALQTEFTADLDEELKRRKGMFKTQIDIFKQAELALKNSITAYMEEEERKARAERDRLRQEEAERQRKIQEEQAKLAKQAAEAKSQEQRELIQKRQEEQAQAAAAQVVQPISIPTTTVRTGAGTVSMKKIWTFEIVSQDELMAAHPEFFIPDTKAINAFVQQTREEKVIDGLRIFQKSSIASR